jgi:hypothetical protein
MSLRGDVSQIRQYTGAPAPITVPTTTTVYSRVFRLNYGQAFGIWYQAGNGSGTANMKIQLEQSYVALTEAQEGASNANYVIGSGVADIETNLLDTTAHVKSVSPIPMKYARFKITGLGTNPADATINIWLFQQELVA